MSGWSVKLHSSCPLARLSIILSMSFCLYDKKNIARRLEFYFLVAKTIFYSLAALVRKGLFCHFEHNRPFLAILHILGPGNESERELGTSVRAKTRWGNQTRNRVFSHDVTAAILVSQNNETAAMLVSQTSPLGVELFSYANSFFCSNKFAYMLAT